MGGGDVKKRLSSSIYVWLGFDYLPRVLSQGVHGVLRVGIAGRRPPRGNHAQVGIDREVLRAKRPERCGVVGQARDGRLQGHYRRVQVGRLLPRVLLQLE